MLGEWFWEMLESTPTWHNYITERSVRWYYGLSIAVAAAASAAARRPWRREHANSKKYSTYLFQILYEGR